MSDPLLDEATARVRDGAPGVDAGRVDALVRGYLDAAEADDLTGFTADDVAGAVLEHLRRVELRPPGGVIVRVANPSREADGWESSHTVVDVITDDMPFLVDSVTTAIVRRGYDIHLLFHPLVAGESHLHLEINRETDPQLLNALRIDLESVLADVVAVVHDWAPMRDLALARAAALRRDPPPTADPGDVAEAATFLEWLTDDHFTFVGACRYELVARPAGDGLRRVPGSELGIAAHRAPESEAAVEPFFRAREPFVLTLTKAAERSTVHRGAWLASVGVQRFDVAGAVVGEDRFVGLYTANVYSQSTDTVPVLRRKVAQVLERAGFAPKGHEGRALVHILETFPRDELFRLSVDELARLTGGILRMGERRRLYLFVSREELGRFVSCLVYMPRERYTTMVRMRVIEVLQRAFGGTDVDFTVLVSESDMARMHVVITTPGGSRDVDVDAVEAELAPLARTWLDDFRDALVSARGEEAGIDTCRAWADAFPVGYQFEVSARDAVADVAVLEALDPAGDLEIRVEDTGGDPSAMQEQEQAREQAPQRVVRVKLYRSGGALVLSDVMPLLEHLGVTVVDERPYELAAPGGAPKWVYVFGVRVDGGDPLTDAGVRARVAELFLGVWAGAIENDGLNRLVVRASLTPRDVVIVRALSKYLRQAGVRFTEAYLADTLATNPDATRLVVALFDARLDPDRPRDDAAVDALVTELTAAIDAVTSLDADRILRRLMDLVLATVRTNAYQHDDAGSAKPYVSVKFDPTRLEFLPAPRPRHEIWVYSPQVEGVHLRAGDVARGGIRWSDRREDFRTEVLGLMKAQTVKNAVIVPVGAKGGFVVKASGPSSAPAAPKEHVLACYRTFIRGLLDVTDNLVAGVAVGPERVVRYDADDTYLVVAADKGTASFSDVANGLAAEYGYWLGDAFASGGSAGFDHKEMGITSRGAWVSVQAHFRAVGVDADTAKLTVIGIGDMSGDVFGNGMLRSRHIQLVAAFDHRHVFVDPDPDPEASYAERARLFALPASSWADYATALISRGGGVFARAAKSVTLSPEARRALGTEVETLTPDELVSVILRAPVDLLWNGGIGTFVKASTESNADVGDRTNDVVRVNGDELRCRVVGEGGNLGFTQRGRVEYAMAGGRINTDAIDNSAGVDTSDHEVNIKILLQHAIADGVLEPDARDPLLVRMTDEVAGLVLADNEAQANALEIASVEAATLVGVHARQMERLEQTGQLDRALEALPTAKALQERHATGQGLTTPELAVLLAYTKLELERALVASDVPDDPYFHPDLVAYFPALLPDALVPVMDAHPLRREIIATAVANAVVNRAGISFLSRLSDETGAPFDRLTRAHVVARDVFDATSAWSAIDALDLVCPAHTQDEMFLAVRRLIERAARWLVGEVGGDDELGSIVDSFGPGVRAVVAALPDLLVGAAAEALATEAQRFRDVGVPAALAIRVASSEASVSALPVTALSTDHDEDPLPVARIHFVLTDRLGLDWLRDRIAELPRADRWQTEARAALRDDFYESQRALTASVLDSTLRSSTPDSRVDTWIADHGADVDRFQRVIADIEATGEFDLATLAVARRALRQLAGLD